jgi:octaprenyl-diphosphate synthase
LRLAFTCALGAKSVVKCCTSKRICENLAGELIGMAFQIKDDILITDEAIGAPTGIDIKEQKNGLSFNSCIKYVYLKEKSWLINSIKNHNKKTRKESKK